MLIFNIIFWFIIFYLITFVSVLIIKNIHIYIIKYISRINDIQTGLVSKPKPKKKINKKWNESLGVWEIE